MGFEIAYIGTITVYLSKGNSRNQLKMLKHGERFSRWFTCPIQSHNMLLHEQTIGYLDLL